MNHPFQMTLLASILFFLMALNSAQMQIFSISNCNEKCDSVCNCTNTGNGCEVKCIGKNLHHIPSIIPKNAVLIDLSHNYIKTISAHAFSGLHMLKILRIENNYLRKLSPDSFRGLTNLQELSLEHNSLALNNETFASYIFVDLVRLETLKLRANNIFNGDYLDHSITQIHSLKSLYIVGFSGKIFGIKYKDLKHLTHLSFSEVNKNSLMKFVPEHTFENVPHLKHLNMSYCCIQRIHPRTFTYLSSLTLLDLSFNRHFSFDNLGVALKGVRNILTLQTLNISGLHSVFGLGTEFRIEVAINLRNTSLKTIRLDSNKLELFQEGALSQLPHTLEYLSIKDNRLTFGWYLFEIYRLPNIRVIDSSFKSREHRLPFSDFRGIIKSNKRNSLNFTVSLEVLLFRECFLKYPLPKFNLRSTSMIRYINASGNFLCPWEGPIKGLERMTWLDLSNNLCQDASDVFFSGFSSLRKLYIHGNLLGISEAVDKFKLLFQNLTKLESLKLSYNHIIEMTELSLRNQVNLKYLDLSRNLFQSFSVRIGHMNNLSTLDLSNNYLKHLSPKTCDEIENISLTHNITVNLKINPLKCTCHYIRFFRWMLKIENENSRIHLLYDYCILTNGTNVDFKNKSLEMIVDHLNRSCSSLMSLILTASILMIILIVLIIGVIIYRYRWNLRYFYYMMKEKYSNLTERADNYMYDAFVSYAEEDSKFVSNEMVRELEEHSNLRLNIHQRDFVPGRKIVENILSAIQQSRLCFVLLSRAFLKSQWCMYEFSMAKMETLYTEREMVVVIILEEVEAESIPLELMHHLKTKSYIEYPADDEQNQQHFWNHIRGKFQRNNERT